MMIYSLKLYLITYKSSLISRSGGAPGPPLPLAIWLVIWVSRLGWMTDSQTDEVADLIPQRLQGLEIVRAHGAYFDSAQEFPSVAPRKFWI